MQQAPYPLQVPEFAADFAQICGERGDAGGGARWTGSGGKLMWDSSVRGDDASSARWSESGGKLRNLTWDSSVRHVEKLK
jgi:hypothetical protein